ncbi:MAG: hypothetical protein LBQ80_03955 [Clostridium sp.]|jgi:hypothetical protein|nr:hypothetical protein [Clostridium sp.]
MKNSKRLLAAVLAVVLALSLGIPALAVTGGDVSAYPVIQIQGSTSALKFNEGTANEEIAFENSKEKMQEAIEPVLGDLAIGVATQNWDKVADGLIAFFQNWMGNLEMELDGTEVYPGITRTGGALPYWKNGVRYNYQMSNGKVRDNHCGFWFDWRKDPLTLADELKDYIEEIKATTGQSKVNLIAVSGSTAMVLAYLDKYGYDSVASIMLVQSLHAGATVIGQLATKQFKINPEALNGTNAFNLFGLYDLQESVGPVIDEIYNYGLGEIVAAFFNYASEQVVDRLYDEAITPILFHLPEFWGFLPDEYYEQAKLCLVDDDPAWADFLERADEYHYGYMVRSDEILKAAAENIKVMLTVGYNLPGLPLGADGVNPNTDALVDVEKASFGAIAAPYGKRLSAKTQAVDDGHDHLSPDGQIDASTCVLPEQTWFFKDCYHQMETSFGGLYEWFQKSDNPTVTANPDYPQYMQFVERFSYAKIESGSTAFSFSDLWQRIVNAFLAVWRYIEHLLLTGKLFSL